MSTFDPFAEMDQTKLFEVLGLGLVFREVRGDEPAQALVGHCRRKAVGIGLKRIASVDAVRPDHASTVHLQVIGTNPVQDLRTQRVALEMQQVPGSVEAKVAVFDGDGVPSSSRELLEDSVRRRTSAELDGGT